MNQGEIINRYWCNTTIVINIALIGYELGYYAMLVIDIALISYMIESKPPRDQHATISTFNFMICFKLSY